MSRIGVSAEFPLKDFDVNNLQITVVTKSGNTIEPVMVSVERGIGKNAKLTTVVSDFPTNTKEISRLQLRNLKPRIPNPTRIELVEVEQPVDMATIWGNVNDLDGDSEVVASDKNLTMTIPPGRHDLAPGQPLNAPLILNQIFGDFTFQVKVTSEFDPGKKPLGNAPPYNGAGIVLWESVDNYLRIERNAYWTRAGAKLCDSPLIEYWYKHRDQGLNTEEVTPDFYSGKSTWLKVSRKEKEIAVSLSHDGTAWDEIKSFPTELPDELFVGVLAINTSNSPFVVAFDNFHLRADRLIAPAIITRKKAVEK